MNPTMPSSTERRNLRLGLILGGVVIGFIVMWIIVFSRNGLPQDPAEYKRLHEAQPVGGVNP